MFIPMVRLIVPLAIIISLSSFAHAKGQPLASIQQNFKGLSHYVFDQEKIIHLTPSRPTSTNIAKIEIDSGLTNILVDDQNITGCLHTNPYDHQSVTKQFGRGARVVANNSASPIEALSAQPYFSGLKGPKLTIMRKDLERALINQSGSASEIFHNALIESPTRTACDTSMTYNWDIELNHHIDVYDSDKAPLIRSDIILNNRLHFGGYFLGTVSTRHNLYDNLDNEPDLRILSRPDPLRQDVLGFAWQGLNLNRAMISGFATPIPDLYLAGHAGYLEEMFFGIGGEFLYRPYDSALSIGGELWSTSKRVPYLGGVTTLDDDNRQTSALLNLWYDAPFHPYAIGLSAGQFLGGDTGGQLRARYTPKPGWIVEGYGTYSNESDQSLDNDEDTDFEAGLRLTMPLGNLKILPSNSRQTFDIKPFARDKGQRLNNPYPLYDLTDPWQAKNLYRYWDDITD
jgi:hypothetical protein